MIWYQDKNGVEKLWFEVDTPVVALKAFSKSSQTGPYMEEPEVDETNCFFLKTFRPHRVQPVCRKQRRLPALVPGYPRRPDVQV